MKTLIPMPKNKEQLNRQIKLGYIAIGVLILFIVSGILYIML